MWSRRVWESFVPQHLVIGRKAMGEGRVKTSPHPALCCHDHRALCMVRGDHPPGGQCLGVNWRVLVRAHMSIKAGLDTRNLYIQGQDNVEVFIIRDVSKVCGQGGKQVDRQNAGVSPHGGASDNVARVIGHGCFLLFVESHSRVPGQGLESQR